MNQKIVFTKHAFIAVLLLTAFAFVSCEKYVWEPKKVDLTVKVSFQTEILPIFTSNSPKCTDCHSSGFPPDLSPAKAYETLTTGGFVNLQNPESSLVYIKLNSSPHNTRCTQDQRDKILAWITQGALNN